MLKDAFEFLATQFYKSKEARILSTSADGRISYIDQDGKVTTITNPPKPRESKVDLVDDLCAAAKSYGAIEKSSLWLSPAAVVLITDDGDRRDRVTLPLRESTQWKAIKRLAADPKLDQAEFIRLLRQDLPGIGGRAELLASVRNIKFRSSAEGSSNIQHGNESMGRVIENAVTGANTIPEQVNCILPLYENQGERGEEFSVLLDLEIVAADQEFRLRPLPDSVEGAQNAALEGIRNSITEQLKGVRIFYGTP